MYRIETIVMKAKSRIFRLLLVALGLLTLIFFIGMRYQLSEIAERDLAIEQTYENIRQEMREAE